MDYNQLRKILILITWGLFTFLTIITVTQAELSVVFTDIDVWANPDYIAPGNEAFLLDEGIDNQLYMNATLIKAPPVESTSYFKIWGATMGEYKINTGFEYAYPICDLIEEPIIFGRIAKQMGIDQCPPKLGTYVIEAYEIDTSTLPDTFLPNKYILAVNLESDEGEHLGNFTLYFTIQ